MSKLQDTLRRTFITACMLTRTTELVARRLGAGFFLPALFVRRYAAMGGLDPRLFASQLRGVRSFKDEAWCGHWNALAQEQLASAKAHWPDLPGCLTAMPSPGEQAQGSAWDALSKALSPLGEGVAAWMTLDASAAADGFRDDPSLPARSQQAVMALRCLVKAITYYQVSAFPGGSAARMEAYARSRSLFHHVTRVVGPLLGVVIERYRIDVEGDAVEGYLVTPAGAGPHPLAIITNGLEGTVQELAMPLLRYHDSGMAVFVMEMPGTYAFRKPMSLASEAVYHAVIDKLSRHRRIDPLRMGFVGVSFGAYWAARMAGTSPHLRCAVACRAPTHHSFQVKNTVGIPEIIIRALMNTTGARTLMGLGLTLKALSLHQFYRQIKIPLLVINGEKDTLLSTQDSVDLASRAQHGTLKLYPHDDHCAMGHYDEWLDLSQAWLRKHLVDASGHAAVRLHPITKP
ncbi:MAG: alpha/beta hydrolase [Aquabacterium sp.]